MVETGATCMTAETVEAIQCRLGEIYILWPGVPENPPQYIRDEDIFYEEPREFTHPNPLGPIFEYEYQPQAKWWQLVTTETGETNAT